MRDAREAGDGRERYAETPAREGSAFLAGFCAGADRSGAPRHATDCPEPDGTPRANAWCDGYAHGFARRLHLPTSTGA